MLRCQDVTKQANDYIVGGLPLSKRIALLLHLAICRCCRHYLQQFTVTIETVNIIQPQETDVTDRQALAKRLQLLCQKKTAD